MMNYEQSLNIKLFWLKNDSDFDLPIFRDFDAAAGAPPLWN